MSYFIYTDLIGSLLDPLIQDQLWSMLVHTALSIQYYCLHVQHNCLRVFLRKSKARAKLESSCGRWDKPEN